MATCRKHGYYDVLEGATEECPFCLAAALVNGDDAQFSDDVKPEQSALLDAVVTGIGATRLTYGELFKDTNPKDAVGIRKAPMSCVPMPVLMELGLAMLEGARKYGRHNYRVAGIRFSVYYDAAMRHLGAWWEGEDIDPGSGLSHITKAIATLTVLRDAMIQNMATDDRPPVSPAGWLEDFNKLAGEIIDRYPDAKAPFTKSPG